MSLGLFDAAFGHLDLDTFLDLAAGIGCTHVELGTGAYVGAPHCDPAALLADAGARRDLLGQLAGRGLRVSALSCHGNPLHPDTAVSEPHHEAWRATLQLAEALEVGTVVTFSGLPGGGPFDVVPNWATASWPLDHPRAEGWQWEAVALPYWHAEAQVARAHGVSTAIEMHAGFLVHSPRSALRLIEVTGVAVNFDPSHLFWQRIDPVAAARALAGHVAHVHAKDLRFDETNLARIGMLDTAPHDAHADRAWVFRSVGDGHGAEVWGPMIEALRMGGYAGPLSIEHEDPLVPAEEGARRGAAFLAALS